MGNGQACGEGGEGARLVGDGCGLAEREPRVCIGIPRASTAFSTGWPGPALFQPSPEGIDALAELWVLGNLLLDFLDGVDDRGVVTPSEPPPDLSVR